LTLEEIAQETKVLVEQGHKRVLVIGGEEPGPKGLKHLVGVIETVYETRSGRGEIRRVNVETAPMSVEDFRELKKARIGTYVVFQETYHRGTYKVMHPSGPKTDYEYRLLTMDRAMQAGIDDVGIGVLFGLHPYKFDVLGMLFHARHLDEVFGTGPHTLSVPRIEPAEGAPAALNPPHALSDAEFKKIVAILRMAVPYTGMILSTREGPKLRAELLDLGISQMSAGSRTEPGGYSKSENEAAQFCVGDTRTLDEVIADIAQHGYVPSFCTGCYRKGRTGQDFMDLAKPGLIRLHCLPNALLTFEEYLQDYASPKTRELGEKLIAQQIREEVPEGRKHHLSQALERVVQGERDIYF
jgi:2-iminoacetate synthase